MSEGGELVDIVDGGRGRGGSSKKEEKDSQSSVRAVAGWLWKQDSDWIRRWRRRWFSLEVAPFSSAGGGDSVLRYSRDQGGVRVLGVIPVSGCRVNGLRDEDMELGSSVLDERASFAFCVQVGDQVEARHSIYMLAADSAMLREGWIRLIDCARDATMTSCHA